MRIRFLDNAKEDLREINRHYRELGGKPLARTMLARIKGPTLNLADHPQLAQRYELAPDIRRLVVAKGAFLVFYRVREAVEVIHVRRAEREPVSAEELRGMADKS